MIAFLKALGLLILLFVIALAMAEISPGVGRIVSGIILLVSLIALFRPLPRLKFGHRAFSAAVLIFVGIPATILNLAMLDVERKAELADLRQNNPNAYLLEIQKTDTDFWLEELKVLDPARYETEAARIAEEKAKEAETARQQAEAEAAAKRAEECGEKNESIAYVMSQEFVKRQLRAPATADFPSWPDEYQVRAMGECKYQVRSYVDAQNGFGALIRSNYSAVLLLHPEDDSWSALEVNIAE
jgi:hypothetical protein